MFAFADGASLNKIQNGNSGQSECVVRVVSSTILLRTNSASNAALEWSSDAPLAMRRFALGRNSAAPVDGLWLMLRHQPSMLVQSPNPARRVAELQPLTRH